MGPSPTISATWVACCAPKQGPGWVRPGPARKKRALGQPFLAPGRHWNGRNVNSLQLLVPVALLGWPEGRGGHPCHPGGLPPTTWWVQHGPRGPGAARAAAPCPPNRCCTAPMQRAANAARKIHNGLFCHLGGLPQPVLEFFLFFFKMRTRTQDVGPDRWPVLQQGLWWPIHIAPQACSFGVWGGMGLRPGPHACLLPPWWLTLGHCTAIGGRTRLGRWLAGPCPPCVANRPSVAHWQNHWGQATEPTMVRACPPSLVCMLHATIFEVPTAGCGPNVSFLEVSKKPPAKHFQAQLHHNGARWPKSEGTFL